jgi:hypothetical protein
MIISRKIEPQFHPPLYFNNIPIKNVTTHKHLGLTFSNDGSWTTHINEIITKASSRLNIIRKLKLKVDRKSLEHMYFSYVRPILEYADVVSHPHSCKSIRILVNFVAPVIIRAAS